MFSTGLRDEFADCKFGDARLDKRILKIADGLEGNPNRSIPAALLRHSDWTACYRFFDNDSVQPSKILSSHYKATLERISEYETVVMAHDSTEFDLTRPHSQVRGAGVLGHEARRGVFYHPTLAVTPDGIPLGTVDQQLWIRKRVRRHDPQAKQNERRKLPIEKKESYRWLKAVSAAARVAEACPRTKVISVSDSESDIYQYFAHARKLQQVSPNLEPVVRAGQERATFEGQDWMDVIRAAPVIGQKTIHVRAREAKFGNEKSSRSRARKARTAQLEIRRGTVEIKRPKSIPVAKYGKSLRLNVVLCEEAKPPKGEDAICWMLVTTLPVDTDEHVNQVIKYYCQRWSIEVYFRTLKSGCRVEKRRFETLKRMVNCLSVMSVVAWRVMYLCHLVESYQIYRAKRCLKKLSGRVCIQL